MTLHIYCPSVTHILAFSKELMALQRVTDNKLVGVFNGIELHASDYDKAQDLVDYYYQEVEDEEDED